MHGADALAAARCAWGAEGSFGATPQCAWSGGAIKKECMDYPFIFLYGKNAANKQKDDKMTDFIYKNREK